MPWSEWELWCDLVAFSWYSQEFTQDQIQGHGLSAMGIFNWHVFCKSEFPQMIVSILLWSCVLWQHLAHPPETTFSKQDAHTCFRTWKAHRPRAPVLAEAYCPCPKLPSRPLFLLPLDTKLFGNHTWSLAHFFLTEQFYQFIFEIQEKQGSVFLIREKPRA